MSTVTWPFGGMRMFGYDVIVADPPWNFRTYSQEGQKKGAGSHNDVMGLDAIMALPVGQLARRDCLLLLWTCGWAMATGAAQSAASAWGFTPITEIVWRKTTCNGKVRVGTGYGARTMHEPILLCTLGNPDHGAFPSLFDGIAREHSRKPDEFYDIAIGRTPRSLRRADLFVRETRPGFDGWGNEATKFDEAAA
ncbi:MT-A70 family methyltransferase [Tardiphaga sp.]|uniref:MT-A70 family methyltransferase n=1 Tax=Tardiphaga sp. TaxID=1926292 RepID=UPI00262E0668|nr:MT-A70 family methyltransferase [Tardiphaga sp.]